MSYDGKWSDGDYILPAATACPLCRMIKGHTKDCLSNLEKAELPDIRTVALGPLQRRVTTIVEEYDHTTTTIVEIEEVDRDAGMASTGYRIVRKETLR